MYIYIYLGKELGRRELDCYKARNDHVIFREAYNKLKGGGIQFKEREAFGRSRKEHSSNVLPTLPCYTRS